MLTETMPAVVRALSRVVPPAVATQIAAALGQCNQPLSHRSGINVQPSPQTNAAGLANPGAWRPSDYPGVFPDVSNLTSGGTYNNVEITNYGPTFNSSMYGGNTFNFPTTNQFLTSQFFGGPTNYFGGDTVLEGNTVTTNLTVEQLTADEVITPLPPPVRPGPPGDPGAAGKDGRDGQAGAAGLRGAPGAPGLTRIIGIPGGGGGLTINFGNRFIRQVINQNPGRLARIGPFLKHPAEGFVVPKLRPYTLTIPLVTGASLDAETCEISLTTSTHEVEIDIESEKSDIQGLEKSGPFFVFIR